MGRVLPWLGTSLLLLGSGWLVGAAFGSLTRTVDVGGAVVDPGASTRSAASTRSTELPPAPAESTYRVVFDRPLFSPTRRPEEPQAREAIAVPSEPAPEPISDSADLPLPRPQFELQGVWGSAGSARAVVLQSDAGPIWIQQGDLIDGWTVAEVGRSWIVLELDDQEMRVELFE